MTDPRLRTIQNIDQECNSFAKRYQEIQRLDQELAEDLNQRLTDLDAKRRAIATLLGLVRPGEDEDPVRQDGTAIHPAPH